jgi:ABC-2 type transport system permease protein
MGKLATGAVQREVLRKKGVKDDAIMGMIQPVALDTHPIGNTKASYCIYLMTTLIPGIIALIAILHTAYVIGRERQERTVKSWMRKAGGNGLKAMVGKAVPYTCYYTMLLVVANFIMYGPMGMPFEGSWLLLTLHGLLMITAGQCASIFLMGCVPDPSVAMSLTSAYATLSFTMCGFSFPVDAMPLPMQAFSEVFPLRHYFLVMRDIAFFGNGMEVLWPQTAKLVAFGVLAIIGSAMFNRQFERRTAC